MDRMMNRTNTSPEHLVALLARCILERDPARAASLAKRYGEAFNAAVDAAWGERLAAQGALLDRAEQLLDKAEAATGDERDRLLELFETYMGAATIGPSEGAFG
jgi:hypothetical protein